ncbi:FadR/GntR family transcriptional regulator [Arthrobacter sp. NPDC093139]|uniref:FadR/GntR family transcriptional regulator n=1 Tax=Arthrobacter sp. NPDC093139 TaxID=3363945 RepID=UPI0038267C42
MNDMRAHRQVLRWIEDRFSNGQIEVGDRLPAERALAEQLKVSRTSVREAVRILESMGVVRAGVGSGPDAGTVVTADPTAALTSVLRLHVATSHLPVVSIVDTRVLLETWAAGNAKKESPALREAEALLEEMQTVGEAAAFLELDVRFHLALVRSAENLVVDVLMASLCGSIRDYTTLVATKLSDWESVRVRLQAEHQRILSALQEGRRDQASELVAEHIESYYT